MADLLSSSLWTTSSSRGAFEWSDSETPVGFYQTSFPFGDVALNVNGAWANGYRPASLFARGYVYEYETFTFLVYDTDNNVIGRVNDISGDYDIEIALTFEGFDIDRVSIRKAV